MAGEAIISLRIVDPNRAAIPCQVEPFPSSDHSVNENLFGCPTSCK